MTYIPRSSLDKGRASSPIPKIIKKKRTFRVFGFLGTTLLLLSVLGTGGVFFYKNYSEGQRDAAQKDLYLAEQNRGATDEKIQEIKTYDAQLSVAERLLGQHLAPSKLFDVLEMSTKETVQFKTFTYEYDPGFEAFLTLGGGTDEFTSVVLQKSQFNSSSLDSPYEVLVVDGITRNQGAANEEDTDDLYEEDEVQFDVTGILSPEQFEYTGTPVFPGETRQGFGEELGDVYEEDTEEAPDNNELEI